MTDKLAVIPSFSKLSNRVWRVLGLNPGKFTLQGTNTYLLGSGARKILLDCGEGKPDYLDLLEQSLEEIQSDAYISDIIISHGHFDHWGGLGGILSSSLGSRAIRVHKYPMPLGYTLESVHTFPSITTHDLKDQQVFNVDDVTLQVIYTPGHTRDHCTFWLKEEKSLFTADCVLGQGSSVFEDLSAYMAGLERLLSLEPVRLYPGHGPVIENGVSKIQEYLSHRLVRENQIVELLEKGPLTPLGIVRILYKDYPESLHLPATRSVLLHLQKLLDESRVGHGADRWYLVNKR